MSNKQIWLWFWVRKLSFQIFHFVHHIVNKQSKSQNQIFQLKSWSKGVEIHVIPLEQVLLRPITKTTNRFWPTATEINFLPRSDKNWTRNEQISRVRARWRRKKLRFLVQILQECSGTGLNVSDKSRSRTKNQDPCMSQLFCFGKYVQKCFV